MITIQAIRKIVRAEDGKIIIQIPLELNDQELEIIILPVMEEESPLQERYIKAQAFKGKARFPDFPISKYDVYEQ